MSTHLPDALEIMCVELVRALIRFGHTPDDAARLAKRLAGMAVEAGGDRLKALPGVAAADLPKHDAQYAKLAAVWLQDLPPGDASTALVASLLHVLRTRLAGLYIPRPCRTTVDAAAVWAAFNGDVRDTAQRFGVSSQWVRVLIKEQRRAYIESHQGDLFR